jgi:uncharacterized LabA/DUF88 family protein
MSYGNKTVYAFVDSQNLNLGVRSQGWVLDFKKFRKFLKDKYNVSHAYLFLGYIHSNSKLYSNLRRYGYRIVFKPTLRIRQKNKTSIKGNIDAELVLYAVDRKDKYDLAVIVSGDGDFYCLIDYLEKRKKLLKIMVPNKKYSSLLRKFSNSILLVSDIREKVEK